MGTRGEDSNLDVTAEYWDGYAREHITAAGVNTNRAEWLGHPVVQEHHRRLRGGLDLGAWLITNYLQRMPARHAVGLGAGVASFELDLLRAGVVNTFDLYDASLASLDIARTAAEQSELGHRARFFQSDINTAALPPNGCDLVTFSNSLHHVERLEALLTAAYEALSPNGILFAHEYIGPSRFAFPSADLEITRRLYGALDPRFRCCVELPVPNPKDVELADPTEAVRSEEIVRLLKGRFNSMRITYLGGALVYPIWYGLNHSALYETEDGHSLVRVLLELDMALTQSGTLPPYFAHIVATKSAH